MLEEFAHYLGLGLLDYIAARFQNNRSFTVVILTLVTNGGRPIHLTIAQKLTKMSNIINWPFCGVVVLLRRI